ncbi:MAG: biotin transporter BioY [Cyanobacteria bacterium J06623_7]
MSDLKELPKPSAEINDYEWGITPRPVKSTIGSLQQLIQQQQKNLDSLKQENKWLRDKLEFALDEPNRPHTPPLPEVILWTAIGVILTAAGTFIPASSFAAPWSWWGNGFGVTALGVSYQVGAVLLTACLGGKNAAMLSQVIYILLGLLGLPIFDRGGGAIYLQQPHFGYLIGFAVGAWLCGWLAFQSLARFSTLIASCMAGLITIHIVGIVYLTVMSLVAGLGTEIDSLMQGILIYSLQPLPGQIAVVCAISMIAFVMRKAMFT